MIGVLDEELVDQIALGAHNLDSIVPGLPRQHGTPASTVFVVKGTSTTNSWNYFQQICLICLMRLPHEVLRCGVRCTHGFCISYNFFFNRGSRWDNVAVWSDGKWSFPESKINIEIKNYRRAEVTRVFHSSSPSVAWTDIEHATCFASS